jgi:DNA adenine methylase
MSRKPKDHAPLDFSFEDVITSVADQDRPTEVSFTSKPFIKWVGGKRSIIPELLARMPATYSKYYEPFLGGGALFFAAKPQAAYLSDINFHLTIAFRVVRDHVEELIEVLRIHAAKHNKPYFLKARKRLFVERKHVEIAALFIYLNKTCYNGLYRVNKAGFFNVPMGSYDKPTILDEETLRLASGVLKSVDIKQQAFDQVPIEPGAFYYLDPPYHKTYSQYDGSGFGDAEHEALAAFCAKIHKVGGCFMLSNSDTAFVRKLYKGFHIEEVSASRFVSCKGGQRGKEQELIVTNYKREQSQQDRQPIGKLG